jgi:hypothetical protein
MKRGECDDSDHSAKSQSGPTDHPKGKPINPGASQSDRLLSCDTEEAHPEFRFA